MDDNFSKVKFLINDIDKWDSLKEKVLLAEVNYQNIEIIKGEITYIDERIKSILYYLKDFF